MNENKFFNSPDQFYIPNRWREVRLGERLIEASIMTRKLMGEPPSEDEIHDAWRWVHRQDLNTLIKCCRSRFPHILEEEQATWNQVKSNG